MSLSMLNPNDEVIALLLDESAGRRGEAAAYTVGAKRLVRDSAGKVTLEAIESQEDFDQTARITGCFQRGKAIRDPATLEVIGWEMEEVPFARATAAN
jgi:hypothetical protein